MAACRRAQHDKPPDPASHCPGRHGWLDDRLWRFEVDDTIYGIPDPGGASWGHVVKRGGSTKLAKIIEGATAAFHSTYDIPAGRFSENWSTATWTSAGQPGPAAVC